MQVEEDEPIEQNHNPPAFNIPAIVLALLVVLFVVHALRTYGFDAIQNYWVLVNFAYVPGLSLVTQPPLPLPGAQFWTPISYGFLHGDWTHLLVNSVWLVAFGSAVARRMGNVRFAIFMAFACAAGALAHLIFYADSLVPVVGASAAISACMGAATRFAFQPGQSVKAQRSAPALSLVQSLTNRSIMTFVVIWFAANWLFGSGIVDIAGGASIAWEAHMGGFLFGLLTFTAWDRGAADRLLS